MLRACKNKPQAPWVFFSSAWCSSLGCTLAQASSWLGPGMPRAPSKGTQVLDFGAPWDCSLSLAPALTRQVELSVEVEQHWGEEPQPLHERVLHHTRLLLSLPCCPGGMDALPWAAWWCHSLFKRFIFLHRSSAAA